jgi:uncharacterized protein YjbI with pentapeptide repeats
MPKKYSTEVWKTYDAKSLLTDLDLSKQLTDPVVVAWAQGIDPNKTKNQGLRLTAADIVNHLLTLPPEKGINSMMDLLLLMSVQAAITSIRKLLAVSDKKIITQSEARGIHPGILLKRKYALVSLASWLIEWGTTNCYEEAVKLLQAKSLQEANPLAAEGARAGAGIGAGAGSAMQAPIASAFDFEGIADLRPGTIAFVKYMPIGALSYSNYLTVSLNSGSSFAEVFRRFHSVSGLETDHALFRPVAAYMKTIYSPKRSDLPAWVKEQFKHDDNQFQRMVRSKKKIKRYTVEGHGVVDRQEAKPRYTRNQKADYAKANSVSLATYIRACSSFRPSRIVIGMACSLIDSLTGKVARYDRGTVCRPDDFDDFHAAMHFYNSGLRHSYWSETELFNNLNTEASDSSYNPKKNITEILARTRFSANNVYWLWVMDTKKKKSFCRGLLILLMVRERMMEAYRARCAAYGIRPDEGFRIRIGRKTSNKKFALEQISEDSLETRSMEVMSLPVKDALTATEEGRECFLFTPAVLLKPYFTNNPKKLRGFLINQMDLAVMMLERCFEEGVPIDVANVIFSRSNTVTLTYLELLIKGKVICRDPHNHLQQAIYKRQQLSRQAVEFLMKLGLSNFFVNTELYRLDLHGLSFASKEMVSTVFSYIDFSGSTFLFRAEHKDSCLDVLDEIYGCEDLLRDLEVTNGSLKTCVNNCIFFKSSLHATKWTNAAIKDSKFHGCDFSNAVFNDCAFSECRFIEGNKFKKARFDGCKFVACNLSGLNFSGVSFRNAVLAQENLSGANLKGADLRGADLSGADLRDTDLTDANLQGANLTGAKFSANTKLAGAKIFNINSPGGEIFIVEDMAQAIFDEVKEDRSVGEVVDLSHQASATEDREYEGAGVGGPPATADSEYEGAGVGGSVTAATEADARRTSHFFNGKKYMGSDEAGYEETKESGPSQS